MKRFSPIIFFLLVCFSVKAYSFVKSEDIRIALIHGAKSVEFSGPMEISLPGIQGRGTENIKTSKVKIVPFSGGFEVYPNSHKYPKVNYISKSILVKPIKEALTFKNVKYEGDFYLYNNSDAILVVNELPLETYLASMLESEMPISWPIEALKAQAIVSRSYALFQKEKKREMKDSLFDMEASVLDQVYKGGKVDPPAKKAVESTSGMILKMNGKPIKAFFHSICGGQTEISGNVWGENSVFKSVEDKYCKEAPSKNWSYKTSKAAIVSDLKKFGYHVLSIDGIELERKSGNPRVATVIIRTSDQTLYIHSNEFRKMLGYENLKSTWFDISVSGEKVGFTGVGFGHGVGMCQWGAKGMAEEGFDCRKILEFYYPGALVSK